MIGLKIIGQLLIIFGKTYMDHSNILEQLFLGFATCMRLGDNGRYQQITIKIAEDIPESSCDTVLTNLKVSAIVCWK